MASSDDVHNIYSVLHATQNKARFPFRTVVSWVGESAPAGSGERGKRVRS